MGFTTRAKWAGTCRKCGQAYEIGVFVTKWPEGWGHVNCPVILEQVAEPEIEMEAETEPEPVKPVTYSPYQLDIFSWIIFGQGHAVIEAVAGSGKTFSIVQAVKYLPLAAALKAGQIDQDRAQAIFDSRQMDSIRPFESLMQDISVGFFAFNAHIAKELTARLPSWCYSATLHSLGYADLRQSLGRVEVDEDKRWARLFEPYPDYRDPLDWKQISRDERTALRTRRSNFRKLAALAKACLIDASSRGEVETLIAHYNLELEGEDDLMIAMLPHVLQASAESVTVIDFDDMQWLPVVTQIPMRKFDYLFVDECQDLNECQTEFVLRSIETGGRVIAVGDRRQAIYSFRGASIDALPNLIERLGATSLPLSITYRCPASHVRLAQAIVPQIQARDNAPEGVIGNVTIDKLETQVQRGDMILCRTNAPLVPVAFGLIRKGIKATIRGKDIGKGLIELADRVGAKLALMESFFSELGRYEAREMERLERRHAPETQIQALADKTATLREIANACDIPSEIPKRIAEIFSDQNGEVILSSVHRAKGLESDKVWILRPDLMPFPKATSDWEIEAEMNIKYVALTRSKDALYFVNEN